MKTRAITLSAVALALGACATRTDDLHDRLLTLDTHLDTPALFGVEGWDFAARHDVDQDGSQIDLPRMVEGGLDGGFFVTYIPQGPLTGQGRAQARAAAHLRLDEIHATVARLDTQLGIATTPAEARRVVASGRRVVLLSMENGYPVGESPQLLAEFHKRGVRMAGPVHFRNNDLATSSTDVPRADMPGLTELGKQWVREANRLGVVIDASHASDATLDDILALTTRPIVLSHSGSKAIFNHPRNVDDDRLLRIARQGGVIQVSAYPDYMMERPPNAERQAAISQARQQGAGGRTQQARVEQQQRLADIDRRWPVPQPGYEQFVEHLLHVIEVVGPEHAGIGIDFDGGGGVAGFNDATAYPRITRSLLEAGLNERQIAGIWGGNVLRVLAAVQKP